MLASEVLIKAEYMHVNTFYIDKVANTIWMWFFQNNFSHMIQLLHYHRNIITFIKNWIFYKEQCTQIFPTYIYLNIWHRNHVKMALLSTWFLKSCISILQNSAVCDYGLLIAIKHWSLLVYQKQLFHIKVLLMHDVTVHCAISGAKRRRG